MATDVQREDYLVYGKSTQNLHFDLMINESGPKDSSGHRGAAMTRCGVQFRVEGKNRSTSQNGFCHCQSRATHLYLEPTIQITMPKWNKYESVSQECRNEWDRFYDAALFHEEGHVEICRDGLKKIQDQLMAVSGKEVWESDFECEVACKKAWDQVYGELKTVYEKYFAEMRAIQVEYDDDTRHGINQGTHLNACK